MSEIDLKVCEEVLKDAQGHDLPASAGVFLEKWAPHLISSLAAARAEIERYRSIITSESMEAHDRGVRREALNEAAKAVYRRIEWMPVEPEIEDVVIAENEVIKGCVAAIEALRSEPSKGQGEIPK